MTDTVVIDENICQQVLSLKPSADGIEQELHKLGIHPERMGEYVKAIKRMRDARRRSIGFVCMAVGALLGFLSCVLTITHAFPDMFNAVFYGLTTAAVCIVVLGLYYVFE